MVVARRAATPSYIERDWDLSHEYASDPRMAGFIDLLKGRSMWAAQQLEPNLRRWPRLRQGSSKKIRLGLPFTCRQIYAEVLHLVYQNNAFAFSDCLTMETFSKCIRKDYLGGIRTLQINDNSISSMMFPSFRCGLQHILPHFKNLQILHVPEWWLAENDWNKDLKTRVVICGDSERYITEEQSVLMWKGDLKSMVGVELLCDDEAIEAS